MDSTDLEICVLSIDPETPIEVIADVRSRLESYMKTGKELLEKLDDQMIRWISTNNRPIEWSVDAAGNVRRFWIGESKSTKCKDPAAVLNVLLENFSVDDVIACLAANAWKHGAIKKLLQGQGKGDLYDGLFEVVTRQKLEGDEPKPQLQQMNTQFLK